MAIWKSVSVPYRNSFAQIDLIDQFGDPYNRPLEIRVSSICVSHIDQRSTAYDNFAALLLTNKLVSKQLSVEGSLKNVYSPVAYVSLNTHQRESRVIPIQNAETFTISSGKDLKLFLCDFSYCKLDNLKLEVFLVYREFRN